MAELEELPPEENFELSAGMPYEQPHVIRLKEFTKAIGRSDSIESQLDALNKLRFYILASDRLRTCAYTLQLPSLLLDRLATIDVNSPAIQLANPLMHLIGNLATCSGPPQMRPTIAQWENAVKSGLSFLVSNPEEFGMACAGMLTNIIIRLTCGMERDTVSSEDVEMEGLGSQTRINSDSSEGLVTTTHLKAFFNLLDDQTGPSLEIVCHLVFRLFTVAADDLSEADCTGFDRCTAISFVRRRTMRQFFSSEDQRRRIIRQLSGYLLTETNINSVVLSVHLVSLIIGLSSRHVAADYMATQLTAPPEINIVDLCEQQLLPAEQDPRQFVARLRKMNKECYASERPLIDFTLLDHMYMLTGAAQKPIVRLLACIVLCMCVQLQAIPMPPNDKRCTVMIVAALADLVSCSYSVGDSEDVFGIPAMAMIVLTRLVPLHRRFEQVAVTCDDLPKKLISFLANQTQRQPTNTGHEFQEWSVLGGRRLFRTSAHYDMVQWSRFFLCFDPADPALLYPMPGITLKRPWLDDRSLRCITLQCITALCSQQEYARKMFLQNEGLLTNVVEALESEYIPIKLSALFCYHILSRSVSYMVKHLANEATSKKVISVLMGLITSSIPDEEEYRKLAEAGYFPRSASREESESGAVCPPPSTIPLIGHLSSSSDESDTEKRRITGQMSASYYKELMVVRVSLAILSNLALTIGPSGPVFLDEKCIETIAKLTKHKDESVATSAIWVLMNGSFAASGQLLPLIVKQLDVNALTRLLRSREPFVWTRTTCLLQNLFASPEPDHTSYELFARIALEATTERISNPDTAESDYVYPLCLIGVIALSRFATFISPAMIDSFVPLLRKRTVIISKLVVQALNNMLMSKTMTLEEWKKLMSQDSQALGIVESEAEFLQNSDRQVVEQLAEFMSKFE